MKSNMFAFYLTKGGDDSDLTLGYYDKTKFKGDLHWNDIKFKYMFGVQLDDVKVNGKSTGVCVKNVLLPLTQVLRLCLCHHSRQKALPSKIFQLLTDKQIVKMQNNMVI